MPNFLNSALFSGPVQDTEEPVAAPLFDYLYRDTSRAASNLPQYEVQDSGPENEIDDGKSHIISQPEVSLNNDSRGAQEALPLPQNVPKPNSAFVALPKGVGSRRLQICQEACKAVGLANRGWKWEVRNKADSPSISLETQNKGDLVKCLQVCQNSIRLQLDAKNITYPARQARSTILIDPPPDIRRGQVCLNPVQQKQGARPVFVYQNEVNVLLTDMPVPYPETTEEFRAELAQLLIDKLEELRLKKIDHLLKIHVGILRLQRYKKNTRALSIADFIEMLNTSRTIARLDEAIGDEQAAKTALEAIRSDGGDLFIPADSSLGLPSEVIPQYTIEASSRTQRIVASLTPPAATITGGPYSISEVSTRSLDESPPFQIHVIRLGRSVDWKIEAIKNNYDTENVRSLFGSAKVAFKRDEIGKFPILRDCPDFVDFVVKTFYEFYWHHSAHLVQVSINRQWDSTKSCADGEPPITSMSITLLHDSGDISVKKAIELAENVEGLAQIVGYML